MLAIINNIPPTLTNFQAKIVKPINIRLGISCIKNANAQLAMEKASSAKHAKNIINKIANTRGNQQRSLYITLKDINLISFKSIYHLDMIMNSHFNRGYSLLIQL